MFVACMSIFLPLRRHFVTCDSTCVLKAEPSKLDIKRRENGILFIIVTHCFSFQTSDYDVSFDFCVADTF